MGKYKTDFVHSIITPVEYATGGKTAKAANIFVPAPSSAQIEDLAEMEQDVNTAFFNVAVKVKDMAKSGEVKPESDKITDDDALQHVMMLSGNGFKLAAGYARLKTLICNKVNPALMDSKEPITETLFEQLNIIDVRILLGKYLLNFLNFTRPV